MLHTVLFVCVFNTGDRRYAWHVCAKRRLIRFGLGEFGEICGFGMLCIVLGVGAPRFR